MTKIIKITKILLRSLIYPSQFQIVFRDFFKRKEKTYDDIIHLKASMQWLKFSQEVTNHKGCSGIYSFEKGWTSPYPETTGYIIQTFIDYSSIVKDHSFLELAAKLGNWEISIQLPTGAVRGGIGINEYPIVFNTGQVIFGWIALYNNTKQKKYLDAAVKAADWLVTIQDKDGKWSKHVYNNISHAHNTRVAWALLEVYNITHAPELKETARKNILWVLSQTEENEWINFMGFTINENPFTHTIAYTLRGLLESSFYFEKELQAKIIKLVTKGLNKILENFSEYELPPGSFDPNWKPSGNFSCLTGNAQLAILFMKLYQLNKNQKYLKTAFHLIEQLKSLQNLTSRNKGIKGGIAGSFPIWGRYTPFGYPNWAAKFFADSLILKQTILRKA